MDKKLSAILLLFLLLGSNFLYAQIQDSLLYNKKGFESYKAKDYQEAINYFNLAINADYSNYIAHYNLACTYAILTTVENGCNTDYYAKAINTLKDCYALDSTRTKEKSKMDHDFDGIRNEFEFNVLIYGLDFYKPGFVRGFIVRKTFRTSIPGSTYYPIEELTINDNKTWILLFHKNSNKMIEYWHGGQKGDPPKLVMGSKKGTWELNGHVLTLFDKSKNIYQKYTLNEPGKIGDLYYPDPNDVSGRSEIRHYWKCGRCGCGPIEGL